MNSPKPERIYQIYPSTFCDSDGDGMGDLKGIIQRLDYIKARHFDAIWINPIYPCPDGKEGDGGYAISDHSKIHPKFGSEKDFNELLEKAHEKGLRVYLDFVPCHTASDHEWFKASADPSHPDHEKYKDFYVWHDGKRDGGGNRIPPNNWCSVFEPGRPGSAWTFNEKRQQWFLHHFHTSQPALNLNSVAVQDAQLAIMKHWMDARVNEQGKTIEGVDGLRIDAIPFANYDPEFRDNPLVHGRESWGGGWQAQYFRHSTHQPQTKEFVARIRALMDSYPADHPKRSIGEIVAGRLGGNGSMDYAQELLDPEKGLHSCYTQSFVDLAWNFYPKAHNVRGMIRHLNQVDPDGRMGHAKDNHDFIRYATRMTEGTPYNLRDKILKQLVTLWMCLPGDKFEYNGSELGLTQATEQDVPNAVTDPSNEKRDRCRTPIPMDDREKNAGFSASDCPLLPVAAAHLPRSVRLQLEQPGSLLNFNTRANEQWKENPALREGELILLETPDPIVAFIRKTKNQSVLCAINMSDKAVHFTPSNFPQVTPEILSQLGLSEEEDVHLRAYDHSVFGLIPSRGAALEEGMKPSKVPGISEEHAGRGRSRGKHRIIFAPDMLFADKHESQEGAPYSTAKLIAQHPALAEGGKAAIDMDMHYSILGESTHSLSDRETCMTFGGSTGVTMRTLRKLLPQNTEVKLFGVVAKDSYGEQVKASLEEAGIKPLIEDWPQEVQPAHTAVTHVITLNNKRQAIVSYPGKEIEAINRVMEKNPSLLDDCIKDSNIVYFPGSTIGKFGLTFAQKLLEERWMHHKELVVSLPSQAEFGPSDPDFFQYMIPSANVVVGRDSEFCRTYGLPPTRPISQEHINDVARRIQDGFKQEVLKHSGRPVSRRGQVAFITRANEPSLLITKDEITEIPVQRASAVRSRLGHDHTANAGFLAGYIHGYSHKESAALAMKLAIQKLEQDGPEPFLRDITPLPPNRLAGVGQEDGVAERA